MITPRYLRISLVLICILFLSGLCRTVAAATLVAGVPQSFPPQYQLDDKGRSVGLAIDILNALSRKAGHEVKYVQYRSWGELQQALKDYEVDLIPTLGIADYRREWADFSLPVETFPISIFVRKSTDDVTSLEDFRRYPLGAVKANIGEKIVQGNEQLKSHIYADVNDAFLDLLAGTIDGLIYPRPTLEKLARDAQLQDKIKCLPGSIIEVKRAIAVPKGNLPLIEQFNRYIPGFLKSQEYKDIYSRWYGEPEPDWTINRLLVVFTLLLSGVVLGMGVWRYFSVQKLNLQLQKSKVSLEAVVRERTRDLAINEEKYRTLYENAPLAYQSLDEGGRYIDVNPQWLRLLGYERSEVIGRIFSDFMHEDWVEQFKVNFPKFRERGFINHVEFRLRHKDGHYVDVSLDGSVGYNNDGSFRQSYCTLQDITESKLTEAKSQELEEQLRQKYKIEAVGLMAGGMAHNFNNNLSIIIGNLEMARRRFGESPKLLSYLTHARESALRSRDLIKKILIYSRAGEQKTEALNVSEVVAETVTLLRSTLPASVKLTCRAPENGIVLSILADKTGIQEALLNLCTNAVHAMDEKGELLIEVTAIYVAAESIPAQYDAVAGKYALVRVVDDGCGMKKELVDKIFDPFFSTKKVFEGTGMGLATVLGMVKQHAGFIKVESSPGQGTCFELFFPLNTDVSPIAENPDAHEEIISGRGERILIVDDYDDLTRVGQEMLEDLGYKVTTCTGGAEALALFSSGPERFDLVLSDQTMPEMSGKELLRKIKDLAPSTPTLLCTGYSSKVDAEKAHKAGIDAFLMKPLELSTLSRRLRDLLDR